MSFKFNFNSIAMLLVLVLSFQNCNTDAIDDVTVKTEISHEDGSVVFRGPPASATVIFGDENAGSPFPPGSDHDESYHAKDKMVPRTVVISSGGEVHYEVAPVHQVAIYSPGTKVNDIDLTLLDDLSLGPFFIPDFIINDPNDRVALSPPLTLVETVWTTPEGTFDTPGKYFVICTTLPHFAAADMYGWVIVK
jgi:plastocyanin